MKTLFEIKKNLVKVVKPRKEISELFENIKEKLDKEGYKPVCDFTDRAVSGSDMDLSIIKEVIVRSLGVPVRFMDSIISIDVDETEDHYGNTVEKNVVFKVYTPRDVLSCSGIYENDIYSSYPDIKWIMETASSNGIYRILNEISSEFFPIKIEK